MKELKRPHQRAETEPKYPEGSLIQGNEQAPPGSLRQRLVLAMTTLSGTAEEVENSPWHEAVRNVIHFKM